MKLQLRAAQTVTKVYPVQADCLTTVKKEWVFEITHVVPALFGGIYGLTAEDLKELRAQIDNALARDIEE